MTMQIMVRYKSDVWDKKVVLLGDKIVWLLLKGKAIRLLSHTFTLLLTAVNSNIYTTFRTPNRF